MWQGPPIAEGRSDDDQEYIVPDAESESEEDSYDSDDEIAASHHFPPTDEGPSNAGPSQPSTGHFSHSLLLTLF